MSRHPYVLTVDGQGRTKPTAIRAKVIRARSWWARRCPGLDLNVVRLRRQPT